MRPLSARRCRARERSSAGPRAILARMRLLLVEDDRMIGESLQRALRLEGYAVDWVRDAAAADSTLASERFDLVLLDLGLPPGRRAPAPAAADGLDVLRAARARHDADAGDRAHRARRARRPRRRASTPAPTTTSSSRSSSTSSTRASAPCCAATPAVPSRCSRTAA